MIDLMRCYSNTYPDVIVSAFLKDSAVLVGFDWDDEFSNFATLNTDIYRFQGDSSTYWTDL